jgi:hypothetical protein
MAAKVTACPAFFFWWLFFFTLTGCAGPCRLTLAYDGELVRPTDFYQFKPGVKYVF